MAAPYRGGSFAARMASMASITSNNNHNQLESWDDGDFETPEGGLLFKTSTATHSVRSMSMRSESNTGDDDWQVLITPDNQPSTTQAITSAAKQAGIPIPTSVPSSALLGGSIKRLGKKNPPRKIEAEDDDWGNDLELPSVAQGGLKLKAPVPRTPAEDPQDDFEWGEGSLGIRFAGTRGGRGSSVSAMSPSLGSIMTIESEDDNDLSGLVLPTEPLDFNARIEKLKKSEQFSTPEASPLPAPTSAPVPAPVNDFTSSPALIHTPSSHTSPPLDIQVPPSPKTKPPVVDEEDFLDGLDFGGGEILDSQKLTLNRNIVVKKPAPKPTAPSAARPASSLTFTDKPVSRIPRPLPSASASRTRLTPVYETGATSSHSHSHSQGQSRQMPTTTSAQLLRAKRSAPVLRNNNITQSSRMPFLPAGNAVSQSHHKMTRSSQPHLRRDSDPHRPQSPSMRSYSRLSGHRNDTPSRTGMRRDLAPSALSRNTPPIKIKDPARRRHYGDGHELDLFDDLPTSATKEKQFEKAPRNMASTKSLRQQPSLSRLPMPDRMATPLPQTPRSPPKPDHTPRFARDTAASRNAREQRLAGTRSRLDGPMAPRPISWAPQAAARSPHASPTAQRKKGTGQKPQLIRQMTQPFTHNEKGMVYNPTLQRWEGNEEALISFSHPNTSTTTLALTTASTPTFAPPGNPFNRLHDRSHSISHTALSSIHAAQKSFSSRAAKLAQAPAPAPVPSPPRPALISQISVPRGVQYEGRMVFDPVKMTWLKAPRQSTDPRSPSEADDDDEDPFAGLDDLKDNTSVAGGMNAGGSTTPNVEDSSRIDEEFDLGPNFIKRQEEEEEAWRRRVEGWVGGIRDNGEHRGGWRWMIRELAEQAAAANTMAF